MDAREGAPRCRVPVLLPRDLRKRRAQMRFGVILRRPNGDDCGGGHSAKEQCGAVAEADRARSRSNTSCSTTRPIPPRP